MAANTGAWVVGGAAVVIGLVFLLGGKKKAAAARAPVTPGETPPGETPPPVTDPDAPKCWPEPKAPMFGGTDLIRTYTYSQGKWNGPVDVEGPLSKALATYGVTERGGLMPIGTKYWAQYDYHRDNAQAAWQQGEARSNVEITSGCTDAVTEVTPSMTDSAVVNHEADAIHSLDPDEVLTVSQEIQEAGRNAFGLGDWIEEIQKMDAQTHDFFKQAEASSDPVTLVRAAGYLGATGYPQAGANLIAIAAEKSGVEAFWWPAVQNAAEIGAKELYKDVPDGVAAFAVATEELRAMLNPGNFQEVLNVQGGVLSYLTSPLLSSVVKDTIGLKKYLAELAALITITPTAADELQKMITNAEVQKLKDTSTVLDPQKFKQIRAQIALLVSLVSVTDMKAKVPEIRTLAEEGAP